MRGKRLLPVTEAAGTVMPGMEAPLPGVVMSDGKRQGNGKGGDALSDRELFKKIVMSRYEPTCSDGSDLLCTSRDLQYQTRDMCTVSVSTVADVMQELGFTFTFVNDSAIWKLSERKKGGAS